MSETLTATPVHEEQHAQTPWPGSHDMPRWNAGPLVDAPRFTLRNWFAMLGPGLLMGGAAIGGGEWLMGPAVTARFGGALMWLATLSILGQVIYNLEISRYTLYTGEPIFTGKFRTLPGPRFWLTAYLILDFGSVFPYLAANAATPLAAVILGKLPEAKEHWTTLNVFGHSYELTQAALMQMLAYAIFLCSLLPLIFGGKIYNALKAVMTFKIVTVFGFLAFIALCFSTADTWREIGLGFVRFGTVPVKPVGSDAVDNIFVSLVRGDGFPDIDLTTIGLLAAFAAIAGQGGLTNVALEQLHPRSRLGHGLPRRRHSQRYRRTQYFAVARRHGVSSHARIHAALAALVPAPDARPTGRMDAGVLYWPGPSQHAECAILGTRNARRRMGRRRHDGRGRSFARRQHQLGTRGRQRVLVYDAVLRLFGSRPVDGLDDRRHRTPLGRRLLDLELPPAQLGDAPHLASVLLRAGRLLGLWVDHVGLRQACATADRGQ